MQQVLFNVPLFKGWWIFPPEGIPVYGFGAMLFITFIATTWWSSRRASKVGLPPERMQDLAIVLFVAGIVGARVLYMIQYADQFPDKSIGGLLLQFFQIWKGGIIFYGSALGGAIGYGLFYWYVLRRLRVSGWQLADAVAPVICLGLAIGRIGCYLNGCCWGQVACEGTCPVPLGGEHLPLLAAHARDQLVAWPKDDIPYGYLQTSTGFAIYARGERDAEGNNPYRDDPRSVIKAVERGSDADRVGLKPGDRIVGVNWQTNAIVLHPAEERVAEVLEVCKKNGGRVQPAAPGRPAVVYFDTPEQYHEALDAMDAAGLPRPLAVGDTLNDLVRDWPRGRHEIVVSVERGPEGRKETYSPAFTPRSIGLYPTQLYETVSMILLIFVLLAFYPFRRHDGELMVVCMIGYSIHRFINESIRIEPVVGGTPLTLSQWGSVVIFLAAVAIEVYLWRVMPSRWATATPPAPPPAPTPVPTA